MTLVPGAMRTSLGRNPEASTVTVTTWGVAGLDARAGWDAAAEVPRGVVVLLGFDADLGAPVLHAGTARAASIAAREHKRFPLADAHPLVHSYLRPYLGPNMASLLRYVLARASPCC